MLNVLILCLCFVTYHSFSLTVGCRLQSKVLNCNYIQDLVALPVADVKKASSVLARGTGLMSISCEDIHLNLSSIDIRGSTNLAPGWICQLKLCTSANTDLRILSDHSCDSYPGASYIGASDFRPCDHHPPCLPLITYNQSCCPPI